jgi:hypothetical protein
MSLDLYGYFHFFDDLNEFIEIIKATLGNNIAIGKYIILHDQVITKKGVVLGKKGKISYAFTSVFSDKRKFEKVLVDGIIKQDNCIDLDAVREDEFDEYDNLKNAKTLTSLREFMQSVKEHNLK